MDLPEGAQAPLETAEQKSAEVPDVSEAGNPDSVGPEEMASTAEPSEGAERGEPVEIEPGSMEEAEEAGQAEEAEGEAEENEGEAEEDEGEAEEDEGEAEEDEGEAAVEERLSTFSNAGETSVGGVPESIEGQEEDWIPEEKKRALREDRESDESLESQEGDEDFFEQQQEEEEEEEAEEALDEKELKLQEQQLRSELLDQYHALLAERNRIQQYNMHLQHKISQALRKKKSAEPGVEVAEKSPSEQDTPEKEQAYQRYLSSLEELKKQHSEDVEWYQRELEQLRQHCQEKLGQVEKEWKAFQALKKQVMLQAMGSCMAGGKQVAQREVEQIQANEDRKEKEMSTVRLENVQLKQCLTNLEARMKAQEAMTEGLHLIDFEQLKIENQTFNEKVEERNEEVLKLHYKVTSNVQIITHVKEKLQFVEVGNLRLKSELMDIDAQVAQKRDILTKTKKARDSLRVDNVKLHQKCGLLGKEMLLRDLEEKVDQTELLSQRLETLKRQHAGLTLSCKGLKQKIKESKAFLPS
ncbi:cilia- and flagella-associated protein 184 [Petaurus breviceps papuanus]|uniref:cilia- and flagella-associated protein 184 n=1 Tax=Petaurus breviceps papuanus TaxID=3040969 RepID=UPI0036D81CFE